MTQVDDKDISLQIWDTAGQEKFRSLTSTYYKGSQGCICVFDLSNDASLDSCDYYINKAMDENIPKKCIYLIGNKSDMGNADNEKARAIANKY
jgi:small GTP-binding protein